MQANTVLIVVLVLGLVIWRRMRSMSKPIKGGGFRLLLPLVFMLIGMMGFMNPQLHLTVKEVLLSLLFGFILSIPMILTTNYEVREDGEIYTRRSKAFIAAIVGLLSIRLGLRSYLQGLDPAELGMLFYLIAVAYVVPWRIASYVKFRKLLEHRGSAVPDHRDPVDE